MSTRKAILIGIAIAGTLLSPVAWYYSAFVQPGPALEPMAMANGRWGYADRNGRVAIQGKYAVARLFYEDVAWVRLPGWGERWGLIDRQGTYLIEPREFRSPNPSVTGSNDVHIGDFRDGQAEIRFVCHSLLLSFPYPQPIRTQRGVIATNGEWIQPPVEEAK